MSGTLKNWSLRILNLLNDALNPSASFSDIDPTEALHDSLDANPAWTLSALAAISRDSDDAAVCRRPLLRCVVVGLIMRI